MAKLQLDIVCEIIEGEKVDLLFDDGRKFSGMGLDIELKVINAFGPAGGWPLIELKGTVEEITNYLRRDYCADEEDVQFQLEYIEL